MSPGIPDRWLAYKACGRVIDGTRIICFKVPLSKQVKMKGKEKWDVRTLLYSIPQLGAVIDLTNTNKYYNPMELTSKGLLYQKIFIPGRLIPSQNKVKQFMDTVDGFLQMDDESLVGVHCTHGLNRTGYMVCRYMRDRLGIPAHVAIKDFQKARGYAIERQNYVADILGKIPPPPDVGPDCTTVVRPIAGENRESQIQHHKAKKQKKRRFNDESTNVGDEQKECKKKEKRPHKSRRSDSSHENKSSKEYNYKYDY